MIDDDYLRHWGVYADRKIGKNHVGHAYSLAIKQHEPPTDISLDKNYYPQWDRYLELAFARFSSTDVELSKVDKMMNYGRLDVVLL